MLIGVDHAFWRNEFKDFDLFRNGPAVRTRPITSAPLSVSVKAHIRCPVSSKRPLRLKKELKSDGRLTGAGTALQQMKAGYGRTPPK